MCLNYSFVIDVTFSNRFLIDLSANPFKLL